MNHTQLSLDQAPAIATPLRFFLTAPLFAILAAAVMLANGPELFDSRWLPQMLGFTHLITLGFVTMTMLGAMFQLLPVLAGCSIPYSSTISSLVHIVFTLGVLALAMGLSESQSILLQAASGLVGSGLLLFLLFVSISLFKTQAKNPSARGMRFSIISLWITLALGLTLLSGHGFENMPLLRQLTPIHIAWGSIGWLMVLLISVAYQVIPMFQVTEEYPVLFHRWLTVFLLFMLIVWSVLKYVASINGYALEWLNLLILLPIVMMLISFISVTLQLQIERKKRLVDATLFFWITGLISLLLTLLFFLYAEITHKDLDILLGILFFAGFAASVICGMLYKIVPFLVWLHLQQKLVAGGKRMSQIPTMNKIISHKKSYIQFYLHLLAVLLLLLACLYPQLFFYPAAIIWIISVSILWLNLIQAVLLYRRYLSPFM